MKGVMLDRGSLDRGDLDFTALEATLDRWSYHEATEPSQVAERIAGADVVVTNKVVLDRAILQGADKLRMVAIAATGTNNVDLEAAAESGIAVRNVRAYATPSVVQHVFSLILALTTRMEAYSADVRQGAWARSRQFCLLDHPIAELSGMTLGIVGFGTLGQAVARTAEAGFGMKVLVAQRPGGAAREGRQPLDELLPQVDVLSLHCPLTPQTRNLIDGTALARMKPGAILVNTARGGIVDEAALAASLRSGRLGGAGVDVLTEEPPRHGNPLLDPSIPNLIVTPHIAWASRQSRQRLLDGVGGNIRAWKSQVSGFKF